MRERAAADIEAAKAQAIADLRGEVAALAIGAAEVVVGRNLDRDTQTQPRRAATSTRSGAATSRWPTSRTSAYAEALFAVARAEGDARRGRGRAVPLRPGPRGQRRAARRRSPTRTSRPAGASRSSRTSSAARPTRPPSPSSRMVVGTGRARELPAIVDSLVGHARGRGQQGGRRGPLGHRAHRRPARPASPRPSARPPASRSRSRSSSTRPSSAASSPRRRHRHRRLRPPPPRAASSSSSKARRHRT